MALKEAQPAWQAELRALPELHKLHATSRFSGARTEWCEGGSAREAARPLVPCHATTWRGTGNLKSDLPSACMKCTLPAA